MGTNFYTLKGTHIGKRSAAGPYCWDCQTTLCVDGNEGVHTGKSKWHENCPVCGKTFDEKWEQTSAARELGFNKNTFAAKGGVKSCSSFTWAHPLQRFKRNKWVRDEYGTYYSWAEFETILKECPIQFFNLIGKEFS